MKQTEILTHATHVYGWEPAVYMSCMSQNFRLFHVSNLSFRNFRIFLLMYTESQSTGPRERQLFFIGDDRKDASLHACVHLNRRNDPDILPVSEMIEIEIKKYVPAQCKITRI